MVKTSSKWQTEEPIHVIFTSTCNLQLTLFFGPKDFSGSTLVDFFPLAVGKRALREDDEGCGLGELRERHLTQMAPVVSRCVSRCSCSSFFHSVFVRLTRSASLFQAKRRVA